MYSLYTDHFHLEPFLISSPFISNHRQRFSLLTFRPFSLQTNTFCVSSSGKALHTLSRSLRATTAALWELSVSWREVDMSEWPADPLLWGTDPSSPNALLFSDLSAWLGAGESQPLLDINRSKPSLCQFGSVFLSSAKVTHRKLNSRALIWILQSVFPRRAATGSGVGSSIECFLPKCQQKTGSVFHRSVETSCSYICMSNFLYKLYTSTITDCI